MQGKNHNSLELYIHIPFCVKKCDYCDFLSGPGSISRQKNYIHALQKEIEAAQEGADRPVTSIFIGGGTPSVLDYELLGQVMEKLKKKFHIAPDAEITIEANPGTLCCREDEDKSPDSFLSEKKLAAYRSFGINRLSLGLQSPQDKELKILGRIHTYEQFLESFFMAREAGFSNINVDLMCAIPEQTYEDWKSNLCTVASLGAEHISAYSLIVEEGTPFAMRKLNLPDEDTEYRMYEDTAGILRQYGYCQYEISNYAKNGFACRHNIGYWQRTDYLGLGLGAASLWKNSRYSNTRDMEKYLELSSFPEKIRCDEETLTVEDQMAEFMFLGLRMTRGILAAEFEREFGCPIENIYGEILEKYKRLSLLKEENGRIFLSREGIHVSNSIMSEFLL